MKKIFILAVLFLNVSCQEKLPKNISDQVVKVNQMIEIVNKNDSLLMLMDQRSIDDLTKDSLSIYLFKYSSTKQTYYQPAKKELDELLKLNSKFSNYPEVVNLNKFYRERDIKKYKNNLNYIQNRHNYFLFDEKEKPIYGEDDNSVKIRF